MVRSGSVLTLALAAGIIVAGWGWPVGVLAAGTRVARGRALAFSRSKGNCLACHRIAGGDLAGDIGPALSGIKARFPERTTLYQHIYDETRFNPQTVMPPFGRNKILTEREIQDIVDYLYTL